jgi:hypothetical protein
LSSRPPAIRRGPHGRIIINSAQPRQQPPVRLNKRAAKARDTAVVILVHEFSAW